MKYFYYEDNECIYCINLDKCKSVNKIEGEWRFDLGEGEASFNFVLDKYCERKLLEKLGVK